MVVLGIILLLIFFFRYVYVEFVFLVGDFVFVMFIIFEGFVRMFKCIGIGDGKLSKILMRFVICRC